MARKDVAVALEEAGGVEELLDRVAAGVTMGELSKELGVSVRRLRAGLEEAELRVAERQRAEGFADAALALSAELAQRTDQVTSVHVQAVKAHIETLKWRAQVDDPKYASSPQVQINNLNTGRSLEEILAPYLARIREERRQLEPMVVEVVEERAHDA